MIHTCKVCGVTSDAAEFYNGVNTRCKECHKALIRKNRADKADYYRKYDAERFQNDPRVKERHAKYRSSPQGIAAIRRAQRKWDEQNPDKRAAHGILARAIRSGRVVKPKVCQSCGSSGRIHGHHDDYAFPLTVDWLCQKCHWEKHKNDWKENWPTRRNE